MKMAIVQLCFIIFIILGLHTMKIMHSSTIRGVVTQGEKIKGIWAVQGKDSTMVKSEDGAFAVRVKPGIWKIIIYTNEAIIRYKTLAPIETKEGKETNLGTINLE